MYITITLVSNISKKFH